MCIFIGLAVPSLAQSSDQQPHKPIPTKLDKHFLIFPESVVLEEWPHTLELVNPPQNLKLLNPGQCIRIGIVAIGDDRDSLLEKTRLSFRVEFAGNSQDHSLAPLAGAKQIKPEGTDFVNAALTSAGIQPPDMTMASIGASSESWCVPANAQDGTAAFEAEADTPDGRKKLAGAKIAIESFETGVKQTFKNAEELEKFTMGYHYQPNPARIYPALVYFCSEPQFVSGPGAIEINAAFLGAALKANPAAAKDFMSRIALRNECPRDVGALAMLTGGYNIDPILDTMRNDDRQRFKQIAKLPDPYVFGSPAQVPTQFDMLWGIFTATGQIAPMRKIASALTWRPDWEEFDKARKSATPIKEWTPSIGRAAAYSAAGWSIGSFQRTDPLAADYIDSMIASPDTPDDVKKELKGLLTNPAFKRQ